MVATELISVRSPRKSLDQLSREARILVDAYGFAHYDRLRIRKDETLEDETLDIEEIQSHLKDAPIGHRVIYFSEVTSTMDVANQEALGGSEEGVVVLAEEQTAGRGRFRRNWISAAGKNLSFSVVLYPNSWASARIAIAATVAVVRAIRQITGLEPSVKWPNDVLLDGKKVAGILVETTFQSNAVRHAILGIGINVNLDPSAKLDQGYAATCLASELGKWVSRHDILEVVLEELGMVYAELKGWAYTWEEWQAAMETLGRSVRVRWGDQLEQGIAQRVDSVGNLVVQRADGSMVTLSAGDVTFQS